MTVSERNLLRIVVPPLLALGLVALLTNPMDASSMPAPATVAPAATAPAHP